VNVYFLDSSALVKRYVPELGSQWVETITNLNSGNLLIISRLAWVEVLSALARRQREGTLEMADANLITAKFRSDLNTQYQLVEIDQILVEMAGKLVNQYPLRAYDAVQLASALKVRSALPTSFSPNFTFLTADANLFTIAQVTGLQVDDPTDIHRSGLVFRGVDRF
jgi:predicted nucleic acid-binding protein